MGLLRSPGMTHLTTASQKVVHALQLHLRYQGARWCFQVPLIVPLLPPFVCNLTPDLAPKDKEKTLQLWHCVHPALPCTGGLM